MTPKTGWIGYVLLAIAVLNSACLGLLPPLQIPPIGPQSAQKKGPASSPDPISDEALAGLSFKDTELYHLFTAHPYNSLRPFEEQFPRVALTVLEAPNVQSWSAQIVVPACWRLRAKVWFTPPADEAPSRDNPSREPEFKDVEPFYWCAPRDVVKEVDQSGLASWLSVIPRVNTGNIRTEWYLPPQSPVPSNLRHQKFWGRRAFDPESMNGLMMASVLYYMGFDWSYADPRVWIVDFIQAR